MIFLTGHLLLYEYKFNTNNTRDIIKKTHKAVSFLNFFLNCIRNITSGK